MTMKRLIPCLLFASMVAACGAEVAPEEDESQSLDVAPEAAQEENLGTSSQELKWTPTNEPWYWCLVGLQICRCSGHVVDCRDPIPILPKPPEAAAAR
jgi:hypothetical protein